MATAAQTRNVAQSEARFFFIMACLMAATSVGGFAMMVAVGVSSFALPVIYHLHAVIFLGWVALYLAQNSLILRDSIALHRKLGKTSALLIPAMVVMAIALTFNSLRITGGPPFFAQAEFLAVNLAHILAFAFLAFWALARRRETDWHRRLMFGAMATVGLPGLARLLPLPLMIPYAFPAAFLAAAIWPVIGMIADKRLHGRVHPAWWWALLVPLLAMVIGEAVAGTPALQAWVASWVEGTPGGARPAGPFLPPGF